MSNGPWIKRNGMDPRPMASTGLRPNLRQRGWNHGPHCRVDVHGPSGPGDPCAVQYAYMLLSHVIYVYILHVLIVYFVQIIIHMLDICKYLLTCIYVYCLQKAFQEKSKCQVSYFFIKI